MTTCKEGTVECWAIKHIQELEAFKEYWASKLREKNPNYPNILDDEEWEEQFLAWMEMQET